MPFLDARSRSEHNRAWRLKNRFAVATSQRAKALRRQYGGELTTADVRLALDAPCSYCLVQPSEVVEHCTPLCRGGANDGSNVVGACESCNDLKGRSTVLEFCRLWPLPF